MTTRVFILGVCIAALVSGCATIHQTAETAGTGTNEVRKTTMTVRTLGDAKQLVEKLRASNGKTHALGAQGLEQESSSEAIERISKGIMQGAIEAMKGPAPK